MSHPGPDPGGGPGLSPGICEALAGWAHTLEPTDDDLATAGRALLDTVAVTVAAQSEALERMLEPLSEAGRWAALAHVLDFDDLHLPSTAHISAVCVPAALAGGGDARSYLAGAGVMARLGSALGWRHYAAGWHGRAPPVPGGCGRRGGGPRSGHRGDLGGDRAGCARRGRRSEGVRDVGQGLQVAFAVEAGLRAAALAAAGADVDTRAVDAWVELVGGDPAPGPFVAEAIPGGLAVKVYPCCYALQRPIAAVRALGPVDPEHVRRIVVSTPPSALTPLIHRCPVTGLEAKFSLEYGVACAVLDDVVGLDSFSAEAVARPAARRLMALVEVEPTGAGDGLLAGTAAIALTLDDGTVVRSELQFPVGAPQRPLSEADLGEKLEACLGASAVEAQGLSWDTAAEYLRGAGA